MFCVAEINRIMFMTLKLKLRHCGSKSLIESSYMVEGANYISIGECVPHQTWIAYGGDQSAQWIAFFTRNSNWK